MVNARAHSRASLYLAIETWAANRRPVFLPAGTKMSKRMVFLPLSGGDWFELIGDYTVAEAQTVAERQAGEPCQFGGSLLIKGDQPVPRAIPVPPREQARSHGGPRARSHGGRRARGKTLLAEDGQ
jgi:hypothetical protein